MYLPGAGVRPGSYGRPSAWKLSNVFCSTIPALMQNCSILRNPVSMPLDTSAFLDFLAVRAASGGGGARCALRLAAEVPLAVEVEVAARRGLVHIDTVADVRAAAHLSRAPGIDNYYVLAGLSSSGVTRSGGMAGAIARWIVDGDPGLDVSQFSLDRFAPEHNTDAYLRERIRHVPAGHFTLES